MEKFLYLGRWVSSNDDDTIAIHANLLKTKQRWGRLSKFLKRKGADAKTMGRFYETILQSILLYASETWVMTLDHMHLLNTFHHYCCRHMCNEHIRPYPDGEGWICPKSARVKFKCRLFEIEYYVQKRRNTLLEFLGDRPTYRTGLSCNWRSKRLSWWSQKDYSDVVY